VILGCKFLQLGGNFSAQLILILGHATLPKEAFFLSKLSTGFKNNNPSLENKPKRYIENFVSQKINQQRNL